MKEDETISITKYRTHNYLVRVEWFTDGQTIEKWYEFANKVKATKFIEGLRKEFETPSIRLYREVLLD